MFLFYQLELGRLDRVCQWRTSGDDWNKIFWATLTSNGSPNATGPTVVLSVCNVGMLWPNGWMDQDATWYGGRPRPRPHCVRWRPSFPHGKGHSSPPPQLFGLCFFGQTVGWIRIPLHNEVGLGPGEILFDGTQLPRPGKGAQQHPTFRPMCVMAKWSPISATAELLFMLNAILAVEPTASLH